jgi:hypothetical protein
MASHAPYTLGSIVEIMASIAANSSTPRHQKRFSVPITTKIPAREGFGN